METKTFTHLSRNITSLTQISSLNGWQSGVEIPVARNMAKVEEKDMGKQEFLQKERAF